MANADALVNGAADLAGADEASDRILRAAIDCMRRFGSSKMSMADVAKASGYSRATVYKYFNNRQELIDAVLTMGRAAFFADLEKNARAEDTLADGMAAAVGRLMKYLHDDNNNPFAGMLDPLDEAMITRQLGGDLINELADLSAALVREAAERGEVAEDVDPELVGEWLGRILFTTHYAQPTAKAIAQAKDMVRGLVDRISP